MKRLLIASVSVLSLLGMLLISSTTAAEADISGECKMSCSCDEGEMSCRKNSGAYIDNGNRNISCSEFFYQGSTVIKIEPAGNDYYFIYCRGNEPVAGKPF